MPPAWAASRDPAETSWNNSLLVEARHAEDDACPMPFRSVRERLCRGIHATSAGPRLMTAGYRAARRFQG